MGKCMLATASAACKLIFLCSQFVYALLRPVLHCDSCTFRVFDTIMMSFRNLRYCHSI